MVLAHATRFPRLLGVLLPVLVAAVLLTACVLTACVDDGAPRFERGRAALGTERTYLKDELGRYVHLRGVNVGGNVKVPIFVANPAPGERDFTYIGRPFPLEEADEHFARIRRLGFNAIRLLFMWEAVYPDERGVPDTEYLDYFEALIEKAGEHQLYVLINAHENLWSRHLWANYNAKAPGTRGDIDNMLYALFPCDPEEHPDSCEMKQVVGDGAPLWATKACLPEKNFGSPHWGTHHLIGTLAKDVDGRPGSDALFFLQLAAPLLGFDIPAELIEDLQSRLPEPFGYRDTTDLVPLSGWWENVIISLDVERCYAAFFAGDQVYPDTVVSEDGEVMWRSDVPEGTAVMDLKEYLQGSFIDAWVEIAKRAGRMCGDERCHPHVIGYDLMNEPAVAFIMLTVVAAYFELGFDGTVKDLLEALLPLDIGVEAATVIDTALPWLADPSRGACEDTCASECTDTCAIDCSGMCPVEDTGCAALCAQQQSTCRSLCRRQETLCVDLCRDPDRQSAGAKIFYLLKFLEMLPPDPGGETRAEWGMDRVDFFSAINLNSAFDYFYLLPFFERLGNAIHAVDGAAIIWLEPSFGPALMGETYMTRPRGDFQVVYSPHWYPDIYPFLGFNQPERDFSPDEIKYRDYTEELKKGAHWSAYVLSNIPVVFGEFGTYWNYKVKPALLGEEYDGNLLGAEQSRAIDYAISKEYLDNYYEAFEKLFLSNFLWCYTSTNTAEDGDGWNREDFSIVTNDPETGTLVTRGESAWSRPYPEALSGKPVSLHYYSPHHYFDPDKGVPDAEREFEVVFESKETEAPTRIVVPEAAYPDGFYVWLSDGWAAWDVADRVLYVHPERDEPGARHTVRLRPPIPGQDTTGWSYFIVGDQVVTARRGGGVPARGSYVEGP